MILQVYNHLQNLSLITLIAPNWILTFLEAGDDYPEDENLEEDNSDMDEYRLARRLLKVWRTSDVGLAIRVLLKCYFC